MPEFKDSVAAEQAEELVTTADFAPKPQAQRRRRHPIGRGNTAKRAHTFNMGPWDGSNVHDVVQERLDRMATADKPAEPSSVQGDTKYSTMVVGNPSPHRREDSQNRRSHHGGCNCGGHTGMHPCEKRRSCGKGILRKVLGVFGLFKSHRKDAAADASAGTKNENQTPCQQGGTNGDGGKRHFRPRNRFSNQRSRPPHA